MLTSQGFKDVVEEAIAEYIISGDRELSSEEIMEFIQTLVLRYKDITENIDEEYFKFCDGELFGGSKCRYAEQCKRYLGGMDEDVANTLRRTSELVDVDECIALGYAYKKEK